MTNLTGSIRRALRRPFNKRRHIFFLCLVGVVLGTWFVPLASAHNSLITVSLACGGTASYTATAWAGPSTASRTNTDVRVFSSGDNGSTWTQVGQGQFNQGDHFSFSGTFTVGGHTSVRVKVQEVANWGDGVKPGPPGNASATGPSHCTTTSTTTTTRATTTAPTTTRHTTTTTNTTTATHTTTTHTTPPTTTATQPATTVYSPSIAIVKTERDGSGGTYQRGPITIAAGSTLDYRLVITNTGNEELTVTVTDPRCDVGTLLAGGTTTLMPGASVSFTCSHRLLVSNSDSFVNTATATGVTTTGKRVGPVSSSVVARSRHGVLGVRVTKVTHAAKPAASVSAAARFTG